MIDRLLPMLAVQSQPFDSDKHVFDIKWDGVRALMAIEPGGCRIWGRQLADYSQRYPELAALGGLPSGTVLDGELVVIRAGRAEFSELMRRHQLVSCRKVQEAARLCPVTYVVFDLLYDHGRSLMGRPLSERRQRLQELVAGRHLPCWAFSDGIVGQGRNFFERVVADGHEGVMAKQLSSRYLPGNRGQAWRKIKPFQTLPCVVIGYTPARRGIRSVLVATTWQDRLAYVAELTSGFTTEAQERLAQQLGRMRRAAPVVPCPKRARWVEPSLYCQVRFLEWTPQGRLRGAHYRGLLES